MKKRRKSPPTELNEYDRKILGKYTVIFSNRIENNAVKAEMPENRHYKDLE